MASTFAALKEAVTAQLATVQAAVDAALHAAMYEVKNGGQIVDGSLSVVIASCQQSVAAAIAAADDTLNAAEGEIDELEAAVAP